MVLPQTVSLVAGQHYWYNVSGPENQILSWKCHADVFEELDRSNFHVSFARIKQTKMIVRHATGVMKP